MLEGDTVLQLRKFSVHEANSINEIVMLLAKSAYAE